MRLAIDASVFITSRFVDYCAIVDCCKWKKQLLCSAPEVFGSTTNRTGEVSC